MNPPLPLDGLRLLVVDDDADTCELFALFLEENGAEVFKATSASVAIDLFQRFTPDMLLSNIVMPDMDGYELVQAIRVLDEQQGKQTPAIAISGLVREEDEACALAAGFRYYIYKPISLNELLTAVVELAGRVHSEC
jgi:CheY-like chemotaxis protein